MNKTELKDFLNKKVDAYNQPFFIKDDPVSIPHLFTKKKDIEIAGFFTAIFSWGIRTTIINKSKELMQLMEMQPHEFCLNHDTKGLKKLMKFRHRTFNATDLLYFVEFMKFHYSKSDSLETAFFPRLPDQESNSSEIVEEGLRNFHHNFFSLEHVPARTKKHIATPEKNSTCKRLNMFLRWMVRNDEQGIDFGIWKNILPSQLICPIDV
ncbi:MAG: TIGR02757 family protein, partial [Bacteroidia bacterium]|nr:TIGR02757 family protein [Bacteroidia bacterium]